MNLGCLAGGRGKSLAKEGVVKIAVSTAHVVPSVATRQIGDTRGKGKWRKKATVDSMRKALIKDFVPEL